MSIWMSFLYRLPSSGAVDAIAATWLLRLDQKNYFEWQKMT